MRIFSDSEKKVILMGGRIYLRPLTTQDAKDAYVSWLNDPSINHFLDTRSATIESVREYIREKRNDPYSIFWGVFSKKDNLHIGNVKLRLVDLRDIVLEKQTPEIGIMIGNKKYMGLGMGNEAMTVAIAYSFDKLGFSYMSLGVIADNERAIRSYHRQGFVDFHVRRHFVCHDAVWYDHITMILKKEQFVNARKVQKL